MPKNGPKNWKNYHIKISMYIGNTDLLGLILGVEVFFLLVTVQEHCGTYLDIFGTSTFKSEPL